MLWFSPAALADALPPTVIGTWYAKGDVQNSFTCVALLVNCCSSRMFNNRRPFFRYTGTRDYTNFTTISAALDFVEQYGLSAIMNYNHQLAIQASELLARMWGTETLHCQHHHVGSMANVRLPTGWFCPLDLIWIVTSHRCSLVVSSDDEAEVPCALTAPPVFGDCFFLANARCIFQMTLLLKTLQAEFDTYILVYSAPGPQCWVRISAQARLHLWRTPPFDGDKNTA